MNFGRILVNPRCKILCKTGPQHRQEAPLAGSLAGLRIRERRLALGLTQVELAQRAGISPSYLNLIEKNRRSVAGRVLNALARALDVPRAELTGAPEARLVTDLQEAASLRGIPAPRAEELIGRFPDWARVAAELARENRDLRRTVTSLSDRLTHDPFLGQSVHSILTNITAIRSTTDILSEPGEMTEAQRDRFLGILGQESARLAEVAQALAAYFDTTATDAAATATPEEALDRFLDKHDHHFPPLDADPDLPPETLVRDPLLDTRQARRLAAAHLARYAEDARALPLGRFAGLATETGFDPLTLAARSGVSADRVIRRLATLRRPGIEAPPMACLQVGPAGHVLMRRPLPGLPLPRHGQACPLWPLFDALTHPAEPQAALCALPDGAEYLALAVATPISPPRFGAVNRHHAAMLLVPGVLARRAGLQPAETGGAPRPVGTGCRVCPRTDCAARAEPAILS